MEDIQQCMNSYSLADYESGKLIWWVCTRRAKPNSGLCGRCKMLLRRWKRDSIPPPTGYHVEDLD